MTSYNGPRQFRVPDANPGLKQDLDRLASELVRAQPSTRRSVIRWRENIPVPLDSLVIVFTPIAGGTLVLPRPQTLDDGRTVIIAVAEGSGPLTVECPRPEASAESKELVQPGSYTFTVIDRVYYVDTAMVGAVPPAAVEFALEADGTSVLGKFDAGTGSVAPIVATADDTVLARVGGELVFTPIVDLVTDVPLNYLSPDNSGALGVTITADWYIPFQSEYGTSAIVTYIVGGGAVDVATSDFSGTTYGQFILTDEAVTFAKLEPGSSGVIGYVGVVPAAASNIQPTATGQSLIYDGSSVSWGSAGTVVTWNSSTTFAVPTGITGGWLVGCGGGGQGGGGARGNNANNTVTAGGGAGGGGAEEQHRWVDLTPGETCTITIGTGGSSAGQGASSNATNGTQGANGGDTTFVCAAGTFTFRGAQGGAGGPWSVATQNSGYGGSTDRGAFGPPTDLLSSNFITVWHMPGSGGPGGRTGSTGQDDGFSGFAGRQGYAGGSGGAQGTDATGAGGSGGGGGGGGGGGVGAVGGGGGNGHATTGVAGSAGTAAAANTGSGGGGGGGGGNASTTSGNGGAGGNGGSGYLRLIYG